MAMRTVGRWFFPVAVLALMLSLGIVYEVYRLVSAQRFNAALERGAFLEVSPRSVRGRLARAYALQRQGKFDEAIRAYAEIESDEAKLEAVVRFNMANMYLRRAMAMEGEEDEDLVIPLIELAKENYRELLRRNSQHWDAKFNLELALVLLPDLEKQSVDDYFMPEHSPRSHTVAPAHKELP